MNDPLHGLKLGNVPVAREVGRLNGVTGILLEATGYAFETGQRTRIETTSGQWLEARVVGFRNNVSYLMPFRKPSGLVAGARVVADTDEHRLQIGPAWRGRIIDGLGSPIDGLGPLLGEQPLDLHPPRVNPMKKQPISGVLDVGVRAINGMLTLGRGQRVGLFAGSGVGKSVLLGMITRQTEADVVVVGLIGERGREVREFIEHSLGPEGLRNAVVVVAPAYESPLMRLMAAELCHAIAAHYRDGGSNVLLLVDSLTRYAMAQREVALALGEPPATRGCWIVGLVARAQRLLAADHIEHLHARTGAVEDGSEHRLACAIRALFRASGIGVGEIAGHRVEAHGLRAHGRARDLGDAFEAHD